MHPNLSSNLHSDECNRLIQELQKCHADNPFMKLFGKCNSENSAMNRCLKNEREENRRLNKIKTLEKRKRMGLA